jgi:hypothetical protein
VDWDGLGTGRGAVGVGDACGAATNAVVVGDGFEGARLTVVPTQGVGAGLGDRADFLAGVAVGGDEGLADDAGGRVALEADAACGLRVE